MNNLKLTKKKVLENKMIKILNLEKKRKYTCIKKHAYY